MKELKVTMSNEMQTGFLEINQLFQMHKSYLDSMVGKQKDQPIDEFIDSQMSLLISLCVSHLERIKLNLIKSSCEWNIIKNKNQQEE